MSATDSKKDYLLALKVMRLSRPTLVNPSVVTSESTDLPSDLFTKILENDITAVRGTETIAAGQFMLLPQSFGNIYLGETFSCYICIHNCTRNPVQNVSVKAGLQTGLQSGLESEKNRIISPIHVGKQTPVTLSPDDTLDDVIHHEVKEIGIHILVFEVHYTTPAGLQESFRKMFKFQALKPLDVKTKFYNADTDEVYLEAQIQNITAGPICLESVELEGSDSYTVHSLDTLPNGELVFKSRNMLEPNNSCQFLYCIKPIPSLANDLKALKQATNIGNLDIIWRSSLGERGRLKTGPLQRSFPSIEHENLRLTVIEANSTVKIGEPFNFTCRVTNTSERSMELQLSFNTKIKLGTAYTGTTEFMLGTIEPKKSKDFKLTVCPTRLGLITITQLQLIDVFLKRIYEFEDFVQVFVVDQNRDNEQFETEKFLQYGMEKLTLA